MDTKMQFLEALLLLCLHFLSWTPSTASAAMSAEDEAVFNTIDWMDWNQVKAAYEAEYNALELLGKNTKENPSRLKIYPENRVMLGQTVVLFCLLPPDKIKGYRTNSITLNILEQGYTHRRSLLAPKRKLIGLMDQLDCWNYVQESVCQPKRDCSQLSQRRLRTVGIITKEGWGVFQLLAGYETKAHYECISEMQSALSIEERTEKSLTEYVTMWSQIEKLQVFNREIGNPQLNLQRSFHRGKPLSAKCSVKNSVPESKFQIELYIMRPPPAGMPGAYRRELLASNASRERESRCRVEWHGEPALLSHHGLRLFCRVSGDFGRAKGRRVSSKLVLVQHMFPVYLDNPRISAYMTQFRRTSYKDNYYTTPSSITLRRAEYVTCKVASFPPPIMKWKVSHPHILWVLDETLFISKHASESQLYEANCSVEHPYLKLKDEVSVKIKVTSRAGTLLLNYFLLFTIATGCNLLVQWDTLLL